MRDGLGVGWPDGVLARYDGQIRRSTTPAGPGWSVEQGFGGKVLRHVAPNESRAAGFVIWSDLTAADADAAIAEQVARFADAGKPWEWKTFGHDQPADLPDRLRAAGFAAEPVEALVVGAVADVAAATADMTPPAGVRIRAVSGPADYAAIARLQAAVWGEDLAWLVEELAAEKAGDPESVEVLLAETGAGEVVSAAWVRFQEGTDFASLWGGSTLEAWRRKGVYRALVARRAAMAAERGFTYLQVDASPDSRPILERLGLRLLTMTTPFTWQP